MISPSQSPYMLKVWSLQISSNEYYKSGQKINNTLLIVCPVPNKAICRYCLENYILNVRSFASMKAERSQLTFYNELLNSSLRPLKDFCGGVQLFSTSNFWLFTAVNWPAFTFLSRQEKAGKKSHEKKNCILFAKVSDYNTFNQLFYCPSPTIMQQKLYMALTGVVTRYRWIHCPKCILG